jgi:hypothetical protein
MSINLEQIDALRERANVSYEDAKEALERCNYDIVEALVYLEKQNKLNSQNAAGDKNSSFKHTVKDLIKKGNQTKLVITKKDHTVLNVPVNVAVIATVLVPPLTIAGVAAALFTNHNIKFEKPDGGDMEINKVINKVSTAVTTAASQVVETINKDKQKNE